MLGAFKFNASIPEHSIYICNNIFGSQSLSVLFQLLLEGGSRACRDAVPIHGVVPMLPLCGCYASSSSSSSSPPPSHVPMRKSVAAFYISYASLVRNLYPMPPKRKLRAENVKDASTDSISERIIGHTAPTPPYMPVGIQFADRCGAVADSGRGHALEQSYCCTNVLKMHRQRAIFPRQDSSCQQRSGFPKPFHL